MEEAYEQQKSLMQRMIDEVTAINLKLEKERELADIIHGVYLSNPSDKFLFSRSFIGDNVQEITAINDLSQRRARVEDLYNKFKLFSSIYGREDLGVKATLADLEKIKNWLDKTNIDVVLRYYGNITLGGNSQSFDGRVMGTPLTKKKATLEPQFSKKLAESHIAATELRNIWMTTGKADNFGSQVSERFCVQGYKIYPYETGCNGERYKRDGIRFVFYLNGNEIGGKWDTCVHEASCRWNCGWWQDTSCWGGTSDPNFVETSRQLTFAAIKQRAMLLFDFETNPESELQKFYKEAGIVPTLTLPFPSMEIDTLIKQCNDFIKRSI